MKKLLKITFVFALLLNAVALLGQKKSASMVDADPLLVVAQKVDGVEKCNISLNGDWRFSLNPQGEFWKDNRSWKKWKVIKVPGECQMQGFMIEHDKEVAYGHDIDIPSDFTDKKIIIRFNGVYSYARVWVNGESVRSHHGGFTSWDCDITKFVKPGTTAHLCVGVTDRKDDISYASGYAKHPIGGILRDVSLVALPKLHIRDINTQVLFDASYRNATLKVDAALNMPVEATVELEFTDPEGRVMEQQKSEILFNNNRSTATLEIPFNNPTKWDAEHPHLYKMRLLVKQNGKTLQQIEQFIGIREIKVMGNQLFVNGKSVKLRGGCRHDIHPLLGRSTNRRLDSLDVVLAKEANLNYIRTSHYPPSKDFLDFCDRYGIYVEEETAICFVNMHRSKGYHEISKTENDPNFTSRYLGQLSEMVDRDRNHASVIIWSIGNESNYGTNFQKEFDFVKSVDGSRPVKFSYPGTAPQGTYCYDLISMHYPGCGGDLNQYGISVKGFSSDAMPVVHDEWAHVPCYNKQTLRYDPNVRNFWGESLNKMWNNCFESQGGLGGAIWGYLDEYFMLSDTVVGYGQWGIVDLWRRKKPEFWHTKKAYSPVKITQTVFCDYKKDNDLKIPVYNRFDHTLLSELKMVVISNHISDTLNLPSIYPHTRDFITIPGKWISGEPLSVKFMDSKGAMVDKYLLTFNQVGVDAVEYSKRTLEIKETGKQILVKGEGFQIQINKANGLIGRALVEGHKVLDEGPYPHLMIPQGKIEFSADSIVDVCAENWKLIQMSHKFSGQQFKVTLQGSAGNYPLNMEYVITSNGEINVSYQLQNVPSRCQELGISFVVNKSMNQLSWKRDGLWSVYPEDHIGRLNGSVAKYNNNAKKEIYRSKPNIAWGMESKDFYLNQLNGLDDSHLPVTNDFKSMKENVYYYMLYNNKTNSAIRVIGQGDVAARSSVQRDGNIYLYINNEWDYVNLNWGNYERAVKLTPTYKGKVSIKLLQKNN